jgi:hypothetical protein
VFPEYYILKVNNFDDVAKDGLDQWIYFLKNGSIRRNFTAKGLREANEALDLMKLSEAERRTYESHLHSLRIQAGVAESTILRAETAEKELGEAKAREEEERRQKEALLKEVAELKKRLSEK